MKFNPGDRVQRVLGVHHGGEIGTVRETHDGDDPDFVYIRLDITGDSYGSYTNRLIVINPSEEFEVDE